MAGHSKWAGIKHKKAIVDARRGKLFTKLARAITVAAKEGGGDIEGNPALGLAVQKARDASMPKDNIERAIAKGTGEGGDADALEAVTYEGYGAGGVALLVEATTDNRNRTGSEVRHTFSKHGGNTEDLLEGDGIPIPIPITRGPGRRFRQDLVRVPGPERDEERTLSRGRLLVLVDHQVREAAGHRGPRLRTLGERPVEDQEEVAAVDAARLGEDPVVRRAQLGQLRVGLLGSGLEGVDPLQQPGQEPGRVAADLHPLAQRHLVEAVEQHRQSLGATEHAEERVEPRRLGQIGSQHALGDLLPGPDPELLVGALEERLDPPAQPPPAGRGRGHDRDPRGPVARVREPHQAPRKDLGLAGPGASEQQKRPLVPVDRTLLRRRQVHRPTLARRSIRSVEVFSADWQGICRRVVDAQRQVFDQVRGIEARTVYEGVGEGGDHTLAIDRRCEDAVFAELEALAAEGASFVAISEERGEVSFGSRRAGPRRDRPDRRLAERPPHASLPQPQPRRRIRPLDGRRRVRLRLRLRRRRGVRRPPRRGGDARTASRSRSARTARSWSCSGSSRPSRSGRCRRSRR